jgi:hypothetical protein
MMRPIPTDTVTRCGAIMTIAADLVEHRHEEGMRLTAWPPASLAHLSRRGGDDQLRPMGTLSRCYFQVNESVASGGSLCITPSG